MGKRFSRLLWIFALALAMRACVVEPVRVTDDSMLPLLQEGDVVLVNKLHYGLRVPGAGSVLMEWNPPKVGDLVVAVSVGDPPLSVLRRIAHLPGETVKMPDGKDLLLKDGEYYLTAEQKDGLDSRKLGAIHRKSIIGRASYLWISKRSSTEGGSQVESPKSVWRFLQPL